jgi:hypothetical protein
MEAPDVIRCSTTGGLRRRGRWGPAASGAKLSGNGAEVLRAEREESREAIFLRAVPRLGEASAFVCLVAKAEPMLWRTHVNALNCRYAPASERNWSAGSSACTVTLRPKGYEDRLVSINGKPTWTLRPSADSARLRLR